MVAHLLRLRFLVLRNTLARSPWQLVAVIIGGLYGLGALGGAVIGLFALSGAPMEVARTVVVLGGSVLLLGWIVIPLAASGVDQTLDPAKLVTFPIPPNRLVVALAACGVLGVPGAVTLLATLATAGTWLGHPLAAVVALLCAVVGTLTCVVASRFVMSLASGLSSGRRFREIAGIVIFIPLVLLGPIMISVTSGLRNSADALPGLADSLSWTPLGAVWAVPSEVARGDYAAAGLKFLIALAVLALIALGWRWSLGVELVSPVHTASRARARGKLGPLGFFPGTPAGAVAARALIYWVRDPRYARSLLLIPVVPVLVFFYTRGGDALGALMVTGPIVALLLSLSIFSDLSYDSTAFSLHVASGMRGVADRAGRVAALATFALPIVIVFTIGSVWIAGAWQTLPGLLGLSLGVLLSGFGLSSVSSSVVVVPVPAPGDSPFKSRPGGGFTTALTTFATWGILAVLVAPELVLFLVGLATGSLLLGWIALAVGGVLGSALLVIGIRVGGARLDDNAVDLLEWLGRQR